ncbi:hypothetical protein [Streptomyces sp. G45]|uniref:hypothetical protein n=1 Tax=Streptomyces sp. G45 TaxID=3406627 RepID=UPI003C287DC8
MRTAADIERVHAAGADAAVVGSAVVARVEASLTQGGDVVADLAALVTDLRPHHRSRSPRPVAHT